MGAIASGGVVVMNDEVVKAHERHADDVVEARSPASAASWRGARRPIATAGRRSTSRGKTVILVDDGLATGSTMRAAVTRPAPARARRGSSSPCRSAPPRPAPSSEAIADECVCVFTPEPFRAVGLWYEDFSQTERRRGRRPARPRRGARDAGARRRSLRNGPPPGGPIMNDRPNAPTSTSRRWRSPLAVRTIRGTLSRPGAPRPWWSSRTAAAAAGSARATSTSPRSCRRPASRRSCSTCWKRTRPTTARRSSTSGCWPTGCRPRPTGWRSSPRPRPRAWATSAPAPGAGAALLAAARDPGLGRRDRLARRPARPRRATRCPASPRPPS